MSGEIEAMKIGVMNMIREATGQQIQPVRTPDTSDVAGLTVQLYAISVGIVKMEETDNSSRDEEWRAKYNRSVGAKEILEHSLTLLGQQQLIDAIRQIVELKGQPDA